MTGEPSFDDLLRRLRAGDDQAAERVFQAYACRLIALARSRLDQRLRPKLDAEDVVQSVFRTFFARVGAGQFALTSWDSLWGLLTGITLRKCAERAAFFHAQRRDLAREVADVDPATREPTPEEAAMLSETVEQLLLGLEERDRQIVALSLQGFSSTEIGARVGWAERTVQRILARVRKRLARHRDSAAAE